MAIGKGFVLHTDFTTHPSQFPAIGTIIQDPDRPVTGPRLSELEIEPATHTHEDDHQVTTGSSSAVHANAWVKFCEQFNVNAGTGVSHEKAESFHTDRLDTKRYLRYPDLTTILPRTKEEAVKNRMDSLGARGSKAVYIVTGLKIARGFHRVRLGIDRKYVEAGGAAALAEQVTTGAQAGASKGTMDHQNIRSLPGDDNDIVYAYELETIAYRSWWTKKVKVSPLEPRGGFSSSSRERDVENEVGIEPTSFEDLGEAAADSEIFISNMVDKKQMEEHIFCASYPEELRQ